MATRRIKRPTKDQLTDKPLAPTRPEDNVDSHERVEIGKTAPEFEILVELAKKVSSATRVVG